jgi:hypothetical protein
MKYYSLLLLISITICKVSAQIDSLDKISILTFQNVKTESISVSGTDFYYRKLGKDNTDIPVIFLNHLGATMDNCDPRVMDGIASKYRIICFDNRGVGATKVKHQKLFQKWQKMQERLFMH